MKRGMLLFSFFLLMSFSAEAQSFSSGSTGADGALDLATLSCTSCTIQLPESGVFNYTTVNIPAGKTLFFMQNSRNTPVYILAQGNVTVAGAIWIAGSEHVPGPGGFFGGQVAQTGFGPGGGAPSNHGSWVGPLSLVPIVGGSGGGGSPSSKGGGGGGAIVIASSTSILITSNATIFAQSGTMGTVGSGGAIRLVANSLNVGGILLACTGSNTQPCGVIRLEAPLGSLTFTGTTNPAAVLSTINPVVVSSTPPMLTISSVGGFPVPSYAGQRFDTVDVLLPNQLTDPITVVVQGNNIPVGTQVSIGVVNGSPGATTTASPLSGTFASSTASPTISNLNRTSVTYLLASATFDPPAMSQNFNPKGADHVDQVRIESVVGAAPKYVFLRKNGTEVSKEKLPQQFLQHFGQ
jgi:hypothetical protein